ncbi:MAG TPA: AsmA family protein [Terracidiphilus sp.]|nr:AsmA family protein [Terracidiphilus sp.]
MQKRWIRIAAIAAAVVVLVLILIPFFVNADTFRPTLQDQLSSAVGRKVTLGHLSFSLFSGSLVADNIAIADDPAFSTTPFIQAKSLHVGVHVAPLIFSRRVEITRLILDSPSINLLHAANGLWNFSSIGGAAATQNQQKESSIPDLTVGELQIKNGSSSVATLPEIRKPFVYSDINLTVHDFSFLKSFPFDLTAKLPASGTFKLTGNAGPTSQKNAADTPFNARLEIKHFDPVAAGIIDPSQGIAMVLDIDSQLVSNGTTLSTTGKIQADHLQLARTGSPAPKPVDIDYNLSENLEARTAQVNDIAIHTGSVAAHVTGTLQLTPQAVLLNLHLAAPNLPIDQLEEMLPAFGVRLPTGSRLSGGALTANISATGPATAATLNGPVEVDNTKLEGFDLGTKIQGLNPFGGKGGGTEIQTLKASVNSTPQITEISNIYANLPQLGTATGNGTVSPSGAIDFKMLANLASSNAVGAVANGAIKAVGTVGGFASGFMHGKVKPAAAPASRGIPITVTGTASAPSVHANVGAILR